MSRTFDFILTAAALIVGIMLLTGHGEVFMKGSDAALRNKIYDQKKTEKVFGVALLAIGILTAIDTFTTGLIFKVIYLVGVIVVFGCAVWFMKTKCKK